MIRMAMLGLAAVALAGAAGAQEAKKPLLLELRGGDVVLMKNARLQGEELCGQIYRREGAPGAGCVAKADVAGARFGDPKSVAIEGVRGALCVALAPVCFGAVTRATEGGVKASVSK